MLRNISGILQFALHIKELILNNLMDIQGQIEQLQKQAAELKARDFDKTVEEIRAKMLVFGITEKDLQVVKRGPRAGKGKSKSEVSTKKRSMADSKKSAGKPVAPKYRGPNGETWSGRGLSPKWLSSLVEQGAKREDFAIAA